MSGWQIFGALVFLYIAFHVVTMIRGTRAMAKEREARGGGFDHVTLPELRPASKKNDEV